MSHQCTPDEVEAMLDFLGYCFGGRHMIPDGEAKAHRVVFESATPAEAKKAIEALVLVHRTRPSPHDVAQRLRMIRRTTQPVPEPNPEPPAPPDVAAHWLAECRRMLAKAGARPTRRSRA